SLPAIASRRNRDRSAATASVAQTTFTRSPGLRPSSHRMRPHTWKLLPWSRGSSTTALALAPRNACRAWCTAACRTGRPFGSVKQNWMNAPGSVRAEDASRRIFDAYQSRPLSLGDESFELFIGVALQEDDQPGGLGRDEGPGRGGRGPQ